MIQDIRGPFGDDTALRGVLNADATLLGINNYKGDVMVYADYVKILAAHFSGKGPKRPTYDQMLGTLMLYRQREHKNPTERLYISDIVRDMNAKQEGITSMEEWKKIFDTFPLMVRAALIRALVLGIKSPH